VSYLRKQVERARLRFGVCLFLIALFTPPATYGLMTVIDRPGTPKPVYNDQRASLRDNTIHAYPVDTQRTRG
jgi:hypothetical protein